MKVRREMDEWVSGVDGDIGLTLLEEHRQGVVGLSAEIL